MNGESPFVDSTPLDIKLGHCNTGDVSHPLRWGILGAGNISRQWVRSLQAVPGATISAVGARELDRAQDFASRLGIPKAFGSYDELVNDPDIDIVYVGTITRLHKDHSLLAINAGKHVLCEKPLANSLADAQEMYEAAESRGVMLQDAMWTRFFPAVEHARTAIERGDIGDPVMVQSDFFDPIYVIQAAPLAFGKDASITKFGLVGRRSSAAVVEYGEHRSAVLSFPPFNCELPETTQIIGTAGRIALEHPAHCPTDLTIFDPPPNGVPSRYRTRNAPAPSTRISYPLPENVSISAAFPNQHGFLYQAEAVHRCLANNLLVCPQYDKEDSLHCMSVLDKVQEARRAAG